MRAIKLTAHLKNGFSSSDPMSPAIDSLIGYVWAKENITDSDLITSCGILTTLDELPIAKERFGDDWWYQCSIPIYEESGQYLRYFHRRFDVLHAERHMKPKKGKIQTASGPTKNFRLNSIVHICHKVEWHLISDDFVFDMVKNITHIGSRTGSGEGAVVSWDMGEGDDSIARFYRPLPERFARKHDVNGYNIYWGYRPAARLPENKTICTIPEVSMSGGEDDGNGR